MGDLFSDARNFKIQPDNQDTLDALAAQVRMLAPAACCPHGPVPCMSCGLNWIVEASIPISLHLAAGCSLKQAAPAALTAVSVL